MERIRCTGYYVSCPWGYHCVKKMKGIPLQMANCFLVLVNVFAKAYRWRKCKKKKKNENGALCRILKLLGKCECM